MELHWILRVSREMREVTEVDVSCISVSPYRRVLNNPRSEPEVCGVGKGNGEAAEGQQPLTLS